MKTGKSLLTKHFRQKKDKKIWINESNDIIIDLISFEPVQKC